MWLAGHPVTLASLTGVIAALNPATAFRSWWLNKQVSDQVTGTWTNPAKSSITFDRESRQRDRAKYGIDVLLGMRPIVGQGALRESSQMVDVMSQPLRDGHRRQRRVSADGLQCLKRTDDVDKIAELRGRRDVLERRGCLATVEPVQDRVIAASVLAAAGAKGGHGDRSVALVVDVAVDVEQTAKEKGPLSCGPSCGAAGNRTRCRKALELLKR